MILEDEPGDIVAKALHGLSLSPAQLAQQVGRPLAELQAIINQHHLPPSLEKWMAPLGIDPDRLSQLENYPTLRRPDALAVPLVTPFGHLGVNSWYLPEMTPDILFDAGTDASSLITQLEGLNIEPKELWITHAHPDHIGGIEGLRQRFPNLKVRGPQSLNLDATLQPGDELHGLQVIDLSGHCKGALGFVNQHVAVVGDAWFAGSIGRIPPEHWHQGIQRLAETLYGFDDSIILLPGHGPATSAGIEKAHNPFFQ